MQDRPTAVELLRAAQEFCEKDLLPQLSGRVAFHTRVLRNVLGILEREWEGEEPALRAEHERLRAIGVATGAEGASLAELRGALRTANADLASRIRGGEFDDRLTEVAAVLRETVREKLAIANPRYAGD